LGNGFSEYPQWVQWYEYTGSFGGTLWIWLVNIVFFKALLRYIHHKEKQKIYRPLGIALLLIGIPILCSYLIGLGYTAEKDQNQIEVLILQPDIDPYSEKYNIDDRQIGNLLNQMTD